MALEDSEYGTFMSFQDPSWSIVQYSSSMFQVNHMGLEWHEVNDRISISFGVNYSFKMKAVLTNSPRFPSETDSFLVLKWATKATSFSLN